jgi:hypothetical protein
MCAMASRERQPPWNSDPRTGRRSWAQTAANSNRGPLRVAKALTCNTPGAEIDREARPLQFTEPAVRCARRERASEWLIESINGRARRFAGRATTGREYASTEVGS